jgi:3-oxoacyl-[acyl-carrier-protein] synthase I
MKQPLELSAFTTTNCLGPGNGSLLAALESGHGGLKPCDFETASLSTYIGEVEGLETLRIPSALAAFDCRNNRLAQLALQQDGFADRVAMAKAQYSSSRIGVFLGTSTSGILSTELAYRRRDPASGRLPADFHYAETQNSFSLAAFVQRSLGLTGPALVVSSACSSSAKVFGSAARVIAAGMCDAAIVGGVDSLCLTTLYGFHSLGLVSEHPCRPFDAQRNGISIGESAGFAILEKTGPATSNDSILLLGVGESSDAHHMSTPHPEGLGARLAMQRALDAAGLAPDAIDYINMHGTATRTNDATEDLAVVAVFGNQTPCSSTKGWTGHALGAAGVTEALICALAIRHGMMPGLMNTGELDPELKGNYLLTNQNRSVWRALSNSFGFGGSNCSLILGRPQ